MRKKYSKEIRAKALALYSDGVPIAEVGKQLGMAGSLVSRWAIGAGLGRNKMRRKAGARKPGARKPGARKPGARKPGARKPGARKPGGGPFTGPLSTVTSLVTDPHITDRSCREMLRSYLNVR